MKQKIKKNLLFILLALNLALTAVLIAGRYKVTDMYIESDSGLNGWVSVDVVDSQRRIQDTIRVVVIYNKDNSTYTILIPKAIYYQIQYNSLYLIKSS